MRVTVRNFLFCMCAFLLFPIVGYGSSPISSAFSNIPSNISSQLSEYIQIDAKIDTHMDTIPNEIFTYDIKIRDLQKVYTPENFTTSKILETKEETINGPDDTYVSYKLDNSEYLLIPYRHYLRWQTSDGEKYSQLWTYTEGRFTDIPLQELSFMSVEDARKMVTDSLDRWNINNPIITNIYSLDMNHIDSLTKEMLMSGHEGGIPHFDSINKEQEVYYFFLGSTFDGIKPATHPNSVICVNKSGIVLVDVENVVDDVIERTLQERIVSLDEALELFTKFQEEVIQNHIIYDISFGYYENFARSDYSKLLKSYYPFWVIKYKSKPLSLPDADKYKDFYLYNTVFINAVDGSIVQKR